MNYKKKVPKFSRLLIDYAQKIIINNHNFYQDNTNKNKKSRKETDVRIKMIKKKLISDKIKNLIDIGSAEGNFLKLASSLGIFALGIEADERRYLVSNYHENFKDYKNYGVIFNELSMKFVKNLPEVDSIIYLSVHHHILATHGLKKGEILIKELFRKAKKNFFFETAFSNEISKSWSSNYRKNLIKMNDKDIKTFFKKIGAREIEIIARTKSYNKGYFRPLYYIKK